MTEREYPRWVHAEGHKSVVAETAEEESSILAQWDANDARDQAKAVKAWADDSSPNALTVPRKGGWPKGKPRSPRSVAVN